MVSFPPCKINLGLSIIAKRPDGYHDLETCFFPIPWTDILEIIPAGKTTFSSSGNVIPGDAKDNLCLKAYHLLKEIFSLPDVSIHLHKVIPTGAGLGGGSSDGAHTIRILNTLFELNLTTKEMMQYAAELGSDCAFFIQDKPMIGTGRGEILESIDLNLSGKFIVLAKPPIHVSTAAAYAGVTPKKNPEQISSILKQRSINTWQTVLQNDFENSVFKQHPSLEAIKADFYSSGAVYASMSGSGSTIFAIFENPQDISFPEEFKSWSGKLP